MSIASLSFKKMFNITKYNKYNFNLSGTSCQIIKKKFFEQSLLYGIRENGFPTTTVNINGHSLGSTVWHFVSGVLKNINIILWLYFYVHEI